MIWYELINFSSRLNTGLRTGASGSFFTQAKPGTKYETIYVTKMGESSFNSHDESVMKTIKGSNQAFYGRFRDISGHECEVKKSFHTYYTCHSMKIYIVPYNIYYYS
jgi:hypothetical protein